MFQDLEKTGNVSEIGAPAAAPSLSDHQYLPQSAPNHTSQGESNASDGSEPILSMYWDMASEEDKGMVEGWKMDADRILIFTGLFSSTVTTLIAVSIQDIRQNSQDIATFYLTNIYQVLAVPGQTNISLPLSPPPFSPPKYAVWVNTFWFLSLVISLTCALLASLVQQWARRYLRATQQHHSLHKRARVRTFFAEGIEKFHLPWAFDALPMLLHISLFLFFAGLVVFLWKVDHTIFKLVLSLVGVCMALYGCITVMPLFRHDCPYYTPLTSLAWSIAIGIPYIIFWVFRWLTGSTPFGFKAYNRFWALEKSYHKKLFRHVLKTAEETALSSPPEIDTRAFLWTFNKLDGDQQLERFFSGLPGFRSSKVVKDPLHSLTEEGEQSIFEAFFGLLDRTFSSDLLPQPIKTRRAIVCAKALQPIPYRGLLDKIVSEDQYPGLKSTEFGHVVRGWGDGRNQGAASVVQAIVTRIVATAQPRDASWYQLASKELDVEEHVLQAYTADDLSLSILIHITRQQFRIIQNHSPLWYSLSVILKQGSKFDVQVTSLDLKLKREFCKLWNEIVLRAQHPIYRGTDGDDIERAREQKREHDLCKSMARNILRHIRNIYISLHEGTDSAPIQFSVSTGDQDQILSEPSSYPSCDVSCHCLDSSHYGRHVETLAASTYHTPEALTSPSSTVTVQHIADRRTPSGVPDPSLLPSSTPSKTQGSKHMHPTGLSSSSDSIMPTPASPSPSLLSISAPYLGAAADEDGIAKTAEKEDLHRLYLPSSIRESLTAAPDHQPQPPSPSSGTDLAIAGPSQPSSNIEHTGDRPPHPSRSQYDIV